MASATNKQDPPNDDVVSYYTLRMAIGILALAMPTLVKFGGWWFEGISWSHSISTYYYTGMRDVFVATLVLVGVLLACHRGPGGWRDNYTASIAGLSAIGIGLFPTAPSFPDFVHTKYSCMDTQGACYLPSGLVGYHMYFVVVFFALSFYLVYFRFSANTAENPGLRKIARNRIYKASGFLMALCFVAIGVLHWRYEGASIFIPESIAVVVFAFAWMVKGQLLLKDKPAT